LSTFRGATPLVSYPRIPGHELCGTIEELASDYDGSLARGDTVTVSPYTACGSCSACRAGRPNCCRSNQTLGVQRDGGATEYLVVPFEKIVAAPALSSEQVTCIEPLSVGFHAAERAGAAAGETLLVFGCGMIGLGVIAAAVHKGAEVIAVDIDDGKLAKAQRLGATHAVNSAAQDLAGRVGEITGGEGPRVVVEAVGRPETYVAAVDLVAYAGRVVYIGYAKERVTYETRTFVSKELDIHGSRNALPEDFRKVVTMLSAGKVDIDTLVTHHFTFDRTPEALEFWASHPDEVTKIHISV
jgi:2-desacetyl-2-hydroxyethyl bacteriochlorophyllide A dehydrogenase